MNSSFATAISFFVYIEKEAIAPYKIFSRVLFCLGKRFWALFQAL